MLLATTALAAAGAFASVPALAADKMSVGVSGYMQQWIAMTSVDGVDADGNAVEGGVSQYSDSEFNVTGKLEADNGLTFSVKIEVEGNTSGDQIDESQATVGGSFGQVVLGSEDHPASLMHYGNQDVGVGLNCGDPSIISGVTSCAREGGKGLGTNGWLIGGDDHKVAYYTPRMAGVQFGAAYIPNTTNEDAAGAPVNNDTDAWSVGLNYMGDMGGSSVALSFGHYQASQTGAPISYVTGAAPGSGAMDTRLSQYEHTAHKKAIAGYEGGRDLMAVAPAKMVKAGDHAAAITAKNAIHNASAMMTKADARTFSNFGLRVGFGAFSFDVAYAAQDGGTYKAMAMPMTMSAADMAKQAGEIGGTVVSGKIIDPSNEGDFTDDGVDNKGAESATNNDPTNETWMVERIVKDTSQDYEVASAGVKYTEGPMAVSLSHMMAEADDGSEANVSMLSFSYSLAPGIASRSSLFAGEQDGNEGAAFVTGITLSF